jgi:hypothetical protein
MFNTQQGLIHSTQVHNNNIPSIPEKGVCQHEWVHLIVNGFQEFWIIIAPEFSIGIQIVVVQNIRIRIMISQKDSLEYGKSLFDTRRFVQQNNSDFVIFLDNFLGLVDDAFDYKFNSIHGIEISIRISDMIKFFIVQYDAAPYFVRVSLFQDS